MQQQLYMTPANDFLKGKNMAGPFPGSQTSLSQAASKHSGYLACFIDLHMACRKTYTWLVARPAAQSLVTNDINGSTLKSAVRSRTPLTHG